MNGLPHDIRGLLPYQTPWWVYGLWAMGGMLVLALAYWAYKYWKSRKKLAAEFPVDPWDDLAGRLSALKPPLPFVGKAQEDFFYLLSLLLREGVELRTGIPATDRTYKELKLPLQQKLPFGQTEVDAVLRFLERADWIKFAGVPSDVEEATACLATVERWVRDLKPALVLDQPFVETPYAKPKEVVSSP